MHCCRHGRTTYRIQVSVQELRHLANFINSIDLLTAIDCDLDDATFV